MNHKNCGFNLQKYLRKALFSYDFTLSTVCIKGKVQNNDSESEKDLQTSWLRTVCVRNEIHINGFQNGWKALLSLSTILQSKI